jgi:hypothetical protein
VHRFDCVGQIGVTKFIEAHGLRTIWIDADNRGAARLEIGDEFFDALFVGLSGGTMIAGKNDGEGFGVGEVFEGIVAAIDPGEVEIGRGRTERENGVVRFFGSLERQEKERCEEKGAQVHRSWAEHTLWGRGVNVLNVLAGLEAVGSRTA